MKKSFRGKQTVIPPEGGWKPNTMYLVEVSYSRTNPVHRAMFHSGFLNGHKKGPGGYNGVIQILPKTHQHRFDHELHEVYYLKVIRELASEEELRGTYEMPPEPIGDKVPLKEGDG